MLDFVGMDHVIDRAAVDSSFYFDPMAFCVVHGREDIDFLCRISIVQDIDTLIIDWDVILFVLRRLLVVVVVILDAHVKEKGLSQNGYRLVLRPNWIQP